MMTKQVMRPKRRPKATLLAYMGACLDMRGHISIAKKDGRCRLRITVPQRFMLDPFRDVYGGSIYKSIQYDSAANWTWEVSVKGSLIRICRDLLPYTRQQTPLTVLHRVLTGLVKWQDATGILTDFYARWYVRWTPKKEEQSNGDT